MLSNVLVALVWAGVTMYVLVRIEVFLNKWLAKQESLGDKQYKTLVKRLDELQNIVNHLSVDKQYD